MESNPKLKVTDDKTVLEVQWDLKHTSRCNVKWLRFHCRCERCKPAFSGMYPLDRTDFDDDFVISTVEVKDNELRMTIDKEALNDHVTIIPLDFLKENCNCDACLEREIQSRDFKFSDPKTSELPTVEYTDILGDEGMFRCLHNMVNMGFCIIKSVPKEDQIALRIGEMIGPVKGTLYAKFFDVRYRPDPYNSSYTTIALPYHQDLPYYETEPGVQLLHAMEFDKSIQGGESQIVDLFQVAEILRQESPDDFEVLTRVPGSFETKDLIRPQPAWYGHVKHHIELDYFGKVVSVHWNPGVEGPLRVHEKDADAYYRAYVRFLRILRRKELEFLFRLEPGDLMIFNNHRVAHARKAYSAGEGNRHLQGCYIDLDDLKSKYMTLAYKLGKKVVAPKIGNGSSF